jgi:hypothetical protein
MNVSRALVPFVPFITTIAAKWVREQESAILADGLALTPLQIDDARRAGVLFPERIRLKFVEVIPTPGGLIGRLGQLTGLMSAKTAGLTLNYGIYIRSAYQEDRGLCVHECVHVGQYERLGSIEKFLRPYLSECLIPGYPLGPLEQEAIMRAHEILRDF